MSTLRYLPEQLVDEDDDHFLFRCVLLKGGWMLNTGGHLGLFVAPELYSANCPPGWVFCPLEELRRPGGYDLFVSCLELARQGRSAWPEDTRAVHGRDRSKDKVLSGAKLYRRLANTTIV